MAKTLVAGQVYRIGLWEFEAWGDDWFPVFGDCGAAPLNANELRLAEDGRLFWSVRYLDEPECREFIEWSQWTIDDLTLIEEPPVVDGATYEFDLETYDCFFAGEYWILQAEGSTPDNQRGYEVYGDGAVCAYRYRTGAKFDEDEYWSVPMPFRAYVFRLVSEPEIDLEVWGELFGDSPMAAA